MAESAEWFPPVPRLRISAMRMSVERGRAEWRRARNGFRVFRASVFPRCQCPLNAEARNGFRVFRVSVFPRFFDPLYLLNALSAASGA
jgi:hypothetical protein